MVLKGARQRQRVPGAGATPFESAWETAVRGAAVQSGPTMAAGAGPGAAAWSRQGLDSVKREEITNWPAMGAFLPSVGQQNVCLHGRLFAGPCTYTGCKFMVTHAGAKQMTTTEREAAFQAGGMAPR